MDYYYYFFGCKKETFFFEEDVKNEDGASEFSCGDILIQSNNLYKEGIIQTSRIKDFFLLGKCGRRY